MKISLILDVNAVAKWFVEENESNKMHKIIRDLYLIMTTLR